MAEDIGFRMQVPLSIQTIYSTLPYEEGVIRCTIPLRVDYTEVSYQDAGYVTESGMDLLVDRHGTRRIEANAANQ